MKNAYIYRTDVFQTRLMDSKEVIDLFGDEYLQEYGHHVPEDLIQKYKKIRDELWNIELTLRGIMDNQDKERL